MMALTVCFQPEAFEPELYVRYGIERAQARAFVAGELEFVRMTFHRMVDKLVDEAYAEQQSEGKAR